MGSAQCIKVQVISTIAASPDWPLCE
jgi:hypothetical protein